jgi:uncharacterized membrane protein YfcA
MNITQIILIVLIGLAGGFLSGTFGIGGGIIIVPALVYIMGMTQASAQGTSLTMMLAPIGILGVINYYKAGYVNLKYAFTLMAVFLVGAYFGSKLAIHLPDKSLKQAFGVLLLLAGIRMIIGK